MPRPLHPGDQVVLPQTRTPVSYTHLDVYKRQGDPQRIDLPIQMDARHSATVGQMQCIMQRGRVMLKGRAGRKDRHFSGPLCKRGSYPSRTCASFLQKRCVRGWPGTGWREPLIPTKSLCCKGDYFTQVINSTFRMRLCDYFATNSKEKLALTPCGGAAKGAARRI